MLTVLEASKVKYSQAIYPLQIVEQYHKALNLFQTALSYYDIMTFSWFCFIFFVIVTCLT